MKDSFVLRGVTDQEVDDSVYAFEMELATVFRAVESEIYRTIRAAMKDGLSIDEAIAKAGQVLDREVPDADATTQKR